MALDTDIGLALASDVGDVSQLQTQSKQLVGAVNELSSAVDGGKTPSNFIIAPSNAVNKERADLVLTGVNDSNAINEAFSKLFALRGEGTQSIRIDFLGGDIIIDEQINIPDNCKLYGNGVKLIARPASSDYVAGWSDEAQNLVTVSGVSPFIDTIFIGDMGLDCIGIDIDGFAFEQAWDEYIGQGTGIIQLDKGNVSNCSTGFIESGFAIYINDGNVSNCYVRGSGGGGCITVNTGNISNCTVDNIDSSIAFQISCGNITNCNIGEVIAIPGICVSTKGVITGCRIKTVGYNGVGIATYGEATISDCYVDEVISGGIGISAPTAAKALIANCVIKNISVLSEYDLYSIGICIEKGMITNCILSSAVSEVGGVTCIMTYSPETLVTGNMIKTANNNDYGISGNGIEKNNLKNGVWTNYGA